MAGKVPLSNCPKCGAQVDDNSTECSSCGIIFKRYYRAITRRERSKQEHQDTQIQATSRLETVADLLFCVNPDAGPMQLGFRILFLLVMVGWGLKFIFTPLVSHYEVSSFWHLVNLPFHEFGHILFRPLGRLLTSMGGSIFQVTVPFICLIVFLLRTRDAFAASFCLWWMGENFMDLAPYINDARSLTLPLLGGNTGQSSPYGFHDWEFILKETNLIRYDHTLASMSYTFGTLLMIVSFLWGGFVLYRQYKS